MRGARPAQALTQRFARAATWDAAQLVIVGLSGGSDSVAVAALAAAYARSGTRLICAHIAHGTRPSGAQDEAVACAVASQLGARFVVRRLATGSTAEADLRAGRYAALSAVAQQYGSSIILTGHHAGDQTETVLLQLFRGTALAQLGMRSERLLAPGIRLVRPVLDYDRAALRRVCEARGLPYALDPTNASLAYARNAIRAALTPLRGHFPLLDSAVARFARRRAELATGDHRARLRGVLHETFSAHNVAFDIDSERLEAISRIVELGAGRRVRVSFLKEPSRSTDSDAVRSSAHMNAAPLNHASSSRTPTLEPPLSYIIYDGEQIAAAIRGLAVEVLCGTPYSGQLVILMVLEGARRFGEELFAVISALPQAKLRAVELAEIGVSSYAGALQSSGVVKITQPLAIDLHDKHVIIVDDILDQGHTLRMLQAHCAEAGARTVKSCVLFDKRDVARSFTPDFAGLEVPPVFVVGYGLDYQENFRTLPYLAALDPNALPRKIPTDALASDG